MLDALDDEGERAICVVIPILGSNDGLRKLGHALRRRLAGQHLDRMREIRVVQKLDEGDHVAARATPAAIEDLFLRIDGKPIFAAAFGTWAAALSLASLAVEHDAAPRTLVFDANGSSFCNPRIPRRRSHAFASSISARSVAALRSASATTVADQL